MSFSSLSLIGTYGLSIGTDVGYLEWPWTV